MFHFSIAGTKHNWICRLDWSNKTKANSCDWVSCAFFNYNSKLWSYMTLFLEISWGVLWFRKQDRSFYRHNISIDRFFWFGFFFLLWPFLSGRPNDRSHWSIVSSILGSFTKYVRTKSFCLRDLKQPKMYIRRKPLVLSLVAPACILGLQQLLIRLEDRGVIALLRGSNTSILVPKNQGILVLVGEPKAMALDRTIWA